ncbi:MAG: HAD hydrolase-like protein [Prevotella sp.]|nr:HAD hydrolase-like protein [Prevotella sp.]
MLTAISNYLNKHGFEQFQPKAVLFDMDGVLYNSMPNHARAWQQSMASFGIAMTATDAYATEGARGIDTIREMVRSQQGREISQEEAQLMYDEKARLFHLMPEAEIFYGVKALMNKIKAYGLQIGVVTGSGQRPLIERLAHDFRQYLDPRHIVTAYDVSQGKPAPTPYLAGMMKVGNVEPWQTIVVENAPLGIRAAVAAQCFTVAINSGPLSDDVLLKENPDLLLPRINHLSKMWPKLAADSGCTRADHNSNWEKNYQQIIDYMNTHHRRPSKHRPEDHQMLNWLKYNKKRIAKGDMPPEQAAKFQQLLDMAEGYRRVNQFWSMEKARNMAQTEARNREGALFQES